MKMIGHLRFRVLAHANRLRNRETSGQAETHPEASDTRRFSDSDHSLIRWGELLPSRNARPERADKRLTPRINGVSSRGTLVGGKTADAVHCRGGQRNVCERHKALLDNAG